MRSCYEVGEWLGAGREREKENARERQCRQRQRKTKGDTKEEGARERAVVVGGEDVKVMQGDPMKDRETGCGDAGNAVLGIFTEFVRLNKFDTDGWCVVLLMRYLGIVCSPGYPREPGPFLPPIFQRCARASPFSNPRNYMG